MIFDYMKRTLQLLYDVRQELINPEFLVSYINTARGQVAAEGECIRTLGTIATVNGTQQYNYASITPTGAGIGSLLTCRMINVITAPGRALLAHRSWEWFNAYYYSLPTPASGQPTTWAQYGQGKNGTFFLYPIPGTTTYTLTIDGVGLPSDMVHTTDTEAEAIPYPWTDAVPYFAAYVAYLSVQRDKEAANMLNLYRTFVMRARQISTPSVLPAEYPGGAGAHMAAQNMPLTGAPASDK